MTRTLRSRRLVALCLFASAVATAGGCSCGDEETLQTEQPVFVVDTDPLRIDFGAVAEHTFELRTVDISNPGRVELHVTPSISPEGSQEFSTPPLVVTVAAGVAGTVEVQYDPAGPGEDEGELVLASDDPNTPELRIALHGGPIFPGLAVDPDPVTFTPPLPRTPRKNVTLRNDGLSDLHITSIGVDPAGNPDFSITPPSLPEAIRPGDELMVEVVYARSIRTEDGAMLVLSDDPADDGSDGARSVPLVAAALGACGNGLDDDGDGRIDWPDDPGCEGPDDDDELNPAVCQPGAQQPCGTDDGECRAGLFLCDDNGQFGPCIGELGPTDELCDGLDNDCDGVTDEEVIEACNAGACQGARACVESSGVPGGEWDDCFPVGATQEVCDNADNDCDGQADEGVRENCVLPGGCSGERLCIPGTGTFTDCQPDASSVEVCDGIDNDCDGGVDENPVPTSCGVGECAREVTGCTAGVPDVCTPGSPVFELCDGLDNDCNGTADDGIGDAFCGLGACARSARGCVNGQIPPCTPGPTAPETCNGIDDDCDGAIDNGACPVCGNGTLDPAEGCDDGNTSDGDGCSSVCQPEGCDPDDTWTITAGGPVQYDCCGGLTAFDMASIAFRNDGATADPFPTGYTMSGVAATCPVGSFTQTFTAAGGCNETYTLTGSFVDANSWTGTFTAEFVGQDCDCFGGLLGTACTDQSFSITAIR